MAGKISIITITLNSECYLEQTISSVVEQMYKNIEYIVVDGGSTDGTLDIIKKYEPKIDRWISEPDDGIADAMNKGLNLASGDYILFLHSDDYLFNLTALERAVDYLPSKKDIFIFQVVLEELGKKRLSSNHPLGWGTNFKMGSCHQGQLCSKKLFDKLGFFSTDYKVVMDYDFILRCYRNGATSCAINLPLSVMRLSGISSKKDWPSLQERFREEKRIHYKHCPSISMQLLYKIYWSLYMPYRKVLSAFSSN